MPTCQLCGHTWLQGNFCPYCGANIGGGAPQIPVSQTPMVCPMCGQPTTPPPPGPQHGLHIVPGTAGQQRHCVDCGRTFTRAALGAAPLAPVLASAPQPPQPRPRYNAANVPHAQRLGAVAGRRVHGRRYELLIYIIAGILCFYIPPIFGIQPLTYLAIALIVFIPIYSLLPGQSQVVESLGGGRITREATGQIGSLMLKSFSKIIAFILIIFQFYVGFTVFRLASLAIALLFYFSMPMHYRTSEPYRMIEAWFRMLLGLFIAYLLATTFSGFGPESSSISLAFLGMGVAFFVTLPIHIPDQNGVVNISFLNNLSESREFQMVERLFFIFVMLASLFLFLTTMSGNLFDFSHIIFYLVGIMALFTGASTGPEGRPALGIIMILIMSFILSSTYSGYAGQALFGYYWPQIQSFGETYLGPLNTVWAQAQSSMGDAWEMMTCPQCYYLKQQQKEQAANSVIMTGGTPMSVEINKFELMPSLVGILEPHEPVISNIELQNKGDFSAGKIDLDIWNVWVNATQLQEYRTGEIVKLTCSNIFPQSPHDSSSIGDTAYCHWTNLTYPTEMRAISFLFAENSWSIPGGDLGNDCQQFDGTTTTDCACPCGYTNVTYKNSGTTVKVNANLTYDYKVNVSMPVDVIGFGLYLEKLQAGEMILKDLTSEYTGGPVKATIWTQKQPARTDIPFLVVASIYNDGAGELQSINDFKIIVYKRNVVKDVEILGKTFRQSSSLTPDGCDLIDKSTGDFIITCRNTWGIIKPGEFKRVSFYVYPIDTITDQKTTQITGQADYTYRRTTSQTLTVANAPPQ